MKNKPKEKNCVLKFVGAILLYWCYDTQMLRVSLSSVCGIFMLCISKALFVLQQKVQEHRWGGCGAGQFPAGDW